MRDGLEIILWLVGAAAFIAAVMEVGF